jgi:hypothetical protein
MSDKGLSPLKKIEFTPVHTEFKEQEDHLNEIDQILERAMLLKQEQEKERQNSERGSQSDRKKEPGSTYQNTAEEEKSIAGSKTSQEQSVLGKRKRCPLIEGCNRCLWHGFPG